MELTVRGSPFDLYSGDMESLYIELYPLKNISIKLRLLEGVVLTVPGPGF